VKLAGVTSLQWTVAELLTLKWFLMKLRLPWKIVRWMGLAE